MALTMYYKIISNRSKHTSRQEGLSVKIIIQINENSLLECNDYEHILIQEGRVMSGFNLANGVFISYKLLNEHA